ncbi:MAG: Xaa-Pro peptidase family protein [Candidatus Omnitrophica bacterium]|nr:Xaa-Pro peptidase family protein [Candidatus Omnitrophota bacterium]
MPKKAEFGKRLALLKGRLREKKLDALLVTRDVNISYLTGFAGHDATLIVTSGKSYFITDSRYIEEAGDSVKGFEVRLARRSLYEIIRDIAAAGKLRRIGFESRDLPYEIAVRLKKVLGKSSFEPAGELIEELRAVKDAGEIALIKDAIRLTHGVLAKAKSFIKPGVSEESLAGKIEIEFLKTGARPSFELIVAADAGSSKPHAIPTARKIKKDSYVMLDIGCMLRGYSSDLTRVFRVGGARPGMEKIWKVVRDAQAKAIELIRPGARIADIDAAARQYIKGKGFGRYFGHALGHGVGMEVHEKPNIAPMSEGRLVSGMIFTVEPAIYIPKTGGIRVEDMVLVTDRGCEVLSQ